MPTRSEDIGGERRRLLGLIPLPRLDFVSVALVVVILLILFLLTFELWLSHPGPHPE